MELLGELTSSRCLTWSSVLLLGGPMSFTGWGREAEVGVSTGGGSEPRTVWGMWPQRGLPCRLGRGREAGPSWPGGCSPSTSSCCRRTCCLPRGERCEEQGTAPRCDPPVLIPWLQVVLGQSPHPRGPPSPRCLLPLVAEQDPVPLPVPPPITAMPRGGTDSWAACAATPPAAGFGRSWSAC